MTPDTLFEYIVAAGFGLAIAIWLVCYALSWWRPDDEEEDD